MVQLNFNATDVAPAGSFTVYESGIYDVMIAGSELKETKAKKAGTAQRGAYLQLNLRIASGPSAGGTVIDRINFENDNTTAEEIGQAQLSAICRVVGVMQLQDSQQLHGIPFKVELAKVERNDKPGEFSNDVKGYMNAAGQTPDQIGTAGAAAPAPAAPVAPAAPAAPVAAPAAVAPVAPVAAPVAAPAAAPVAPAAAPVAQPPAAAPPAETAPAPVAPAAAPVAEQPAAPAAAPAATGAPPWAQQPQ